MSSQCLQIFVKPLSLTTIADLNPLLMFAQKQFDLYFYSKFDFLLHADNLLYKIQK